MLKGAFDVFSSTVLTWYVKQVIFILLLKENHNTKIFFIPMKHKKAFLSLFARKSVVVVTVPLKQIDFFKQQAKVL